jgi:sugar-specific transcriptional regulator TrmB
VDIEVLFTYLANLAAKLATQAFVALYMTQIQSLLETIGLNHHESSVYLQLLQHGELPASAVARQTRIPRSTVRGTLDKLCERGIVRKLYKRNTQYYRCEDPSSLIRHLHSRIDEDQRALKSVEGALPQLKAMLRKDSVIPKVTYFEGPAGVIEAFNHSLFVEGIPEILFFTSYSFIRDAVILHNDDDFYIPLRIKKGIRMRVLVGKKPDLDPRKKYNDPAELRERRYIPDGFALPGNIHVYGNFVVYFSADEREYMAVLVESAMMADTMRALFNFMWERCEP